MDNLLDLYMEHLFDLDSFDPNEMRKTLPEIQIQMFAVFYLSTSLMRGGITGYFTEHHNDELHEQLLEGLELLNEQKKIELIKQCKHIMNDNAVINKNEALEELFQTNKKHLDGHELYEKVQQYISKNENEFKPV